VQIPAVFAGGIALRYGGFYGEEDAMVKAVRKRRFPLIGDGGGMMSFSHLDDAAAATVLALDFDGPATYNTTDDEPAPMRDWVPALAAVGAKPPYRLPGWVGTMFMGKTLTMMTEARGASNAKAKKELGWTLRYPSWRDGFPASYSRRPLRLAAVRRASSPDRGSRSMRMASGADAVILPIAGEENESVERRRRVRRQKRPETARERQEQAEVGIKA
jgi:hypothetical protein